MPISLRGLVTGRVQGVGFRYFVLRQARQVGVTGFVGNLPDGRVEFLLQGEQAQVDSMLERLRRGPDYARVDALDTEPAPDAPVERSFVIR